MHWEDRFWTLSEHQEGLLARFQLPAIGATLEDWRAARQSRRWAPWGPRLVAQRGLALTDRRRALAGVLDASPGAVLFWRSTLAWFGLRGYDLRSIQVARPRAMSGTRSVLASVHEVRSLRAADVVVARGIVTVTPLRAIWAEAARYAAPRMHDLGADRIGALLDEAHRLDLVRWADLQASVEELQCRGRAGTVVMRALAEARPPGSSATESRSERQFEKVLDQYRQRGFRRQVVVGAVAPIGRIDFVDDRLPVVVEVNSRRFHTTPTDRAADERRYRMLVDAGFTVAVVWEDDLWSAPRSVRDVVVEARRRAQRGDHGVVHSPGCPWPAPLLGSVIVDDAA